MSILLGLVFAGVAVFILFTLVINRIQSSRTKKNRRIKEPEPTINNKKDNIVELGDISEVTSANSNSGNGDNIIDFGEIAKEDDSLGSSIEELGDDYLTENVDIVVMDEKTEPEIVFDDKLLVLYVLSNGDQSFEGYELYQTLVDEGLAFGELDIFHFIDKESNRHIFSVTQATEPGFFDIDHFGSNSYHGLCFVMNEKNTDIGKQDFECMLEKASVISEQLKGLLCDQSKQPITYDNLSSYYDKILRADKNVSF